jgi:hypothetical protein
MNTSVTSRASPSDENRRLVEEFRKYFKGHHVDGGAI